MFLTYTWRGYSIRVTTKLNDTPSLVAFCYQQQHKIGTTIGYGDISPKSDIGKIAVALYAILAINVMASVLEPAKEFLQSFCLESEDTWDTTEDFDIDDDDDNTPARTTQQKKMKQQKKKKTK